MRRSHLRTQAAALLDMYDALGSVSDDLAATLAGPRFLPLLTRLAELADAAQDEFEAMFADFEAGLARPETWKAAVTDGSVSWGAVRSLCARLSVRSLELRITHKRATHVRTLPNFWRRKQHACDALSDSWRYTHPCHHRRIPPFLRRIRQVHPAVAQTLAHLDALLAHSLAPQLLLPLAPASSVPAKTAPSASSPASHPSPVAALVDRVLTELESALDAKARTCKCKVRRFWFG